MAWVQVPAGPARRRRPRMHVRSCTRPLGSSRCDCCGATAVVCVVAASKDGRGYAWPTLHTRRDGVAQARGGRAAFRVSVRKRARACETVRHHSEHLSFIPRVNSCTHTPPPATLTRHAPTHVRTQKHVEARVSALIRVIIVSLALAQKSPHRRDANTHAGTCSGGRESGTTRRRLGADGVRGSVRAGHKQASVRLSENSADTVVQVNAAYSLALGFEGTFRTPPIRPRWIPCPPDSRGAGGSHFLDALDILQTLGWRRRRRRLPLSSLCPYALSGLSIAPASSSS